MICVKQGRQVMDEVRAERDAPWMQDCIGHPGNVRAVPAAWRLSAL